MKQHYTEFQFKAPYYTKNELTGSTETIWLVCHGYGQLAKFFMRKFSVLDKEKNFFIFPQGLSKFYLDDHERVGATWMTREDRLTDIENQYTYLDQVLYNELGPDHGRYRLNLLGFSQGVATIMRYLVYKKLRFDKLILWGGGIPEELKPEDFDFLSDHATVQMVIGDQDQYYTEEAFEKQIFRAKELMGDTVRKVLYKGAHMISADLLPEL